MTSGNSTHLRILVVDDDERILNLYRRTLAEPVSSIQDGKLSADLETDLVGAGEGLSEKTPGFEVVACRQGNEALSVAEKAAIRGDPFAVAFIDVRLPPGPDGVWTAEKIREVSPDTHIAIVTAYTDVDPSEISRRVPPVDKLLYAQKPLAPAEIRQLAHALGSKWLLERDLRRALAAAESANRAKSVFLANMSHELRTPITSMLGFLDLLNRPTYGKLTTQQSEFVGIVRRNSKHLLSLINGLLDLARIEAGVLDLGLARVDGNALLCECVEMVRESAGEKKLSLSVQGSGIGFFVADAQKIRQSLLNLLHNAIKFTNEGGKVGAVGVRSENEVTFTVWDSGIGIPKDQQEAIFNEFHRIDPLSRKGTGIGLALTRKLVELHRGRIWVESMPHLGSRFSFTVPLNLKPGVAPSPAVENERAPSRTTAGGGVLLVIEDDPDVLTFMSLMFEANGYAVETASCGKDGLKLAPIVHPDLVLLDVRLPDMTGVEVLAELRRIPEVGSVPVFAITAHALIGDREALLGKGFSRYFSKPFDSNELLAEVGKTLAG